MCAHLSVYVCMCVKAKFCLDTVVVQLTRSIAE